MRGAAPATVWSHDLEERVLAPDPRCRESCGDSAKAGRRRGGDWGRLMTQHRASRLWAFIKRDFLVTETSYPLSRSCCRSVGMLLSLLVFFFVDQDDQARHRRGSTGSRRFSWILFGYCRSSSTSPPRSVRVLGRRSATSRCSAPSRRCWSRPTPTSMVIFSSAAWDFVVRRDPRAGSIMLFAVLAVRRATCTSTSLGDRSCWASLLTLLSFGGASASSPPRSSSTSSGATRSTSC